MVIASGMSLLYFDWPSAWSLDSLGKFAIEKLPMLGNEDFLE